MVQDYVAAVLFASAIESQYQNRYRTCMRYHQELHRRQSNHDADDSIATVNRPLSMMCDIDRAGVIADRSCEILSMAVPMREVNVECGLESV